MLPIAVQCGVSIFDFWDYTYGELNIVIKAKNDMELMKMRENALNTYVLADLIGASVARLMDKNAKYPTIDKVFPSLFEPQEPKQQDWRNAKDWLLKYADAHNKKRGEAQ